MCCATADNMHCTKLSDRTKRATYLHQHNRGFGCFVCRILPLLHGAGEGEIANERAADKAGKQPVARSAESPLPLDDIGP
jgi:hypothetical protein